MRLKKSCLCLTIKQGSVLSILVDLLKICVTLILLVVYIVTGYDKGFHVEIQTVQAPQQLTDGKSSAKTLLSIVVIFIGDLLKYSVIGIVGIVMLLKKWRTLLIGTYFWVKCLSSFLNIFSSLLMVTLVQLPFSDMILSLSTFALDQYFCLVIYSYWQQRKDYDSYILQQNEHGIPSNAARERSHDNNEVA